MAVEAAGSAPAEGSSGCVWGCAPEAWEGGICHSPAAILHKGSLKKPNRVKRNLHPIRNAEKQLQNCNGNRRISDYRVEIHAQNSFREELPH